jgi:hypothetical protein
MPESAPRVPIPASATTPELLAILARQIEAETSLDFQVKFDHTKGFQPNEHCIWLPVKYSKVGVTITRKQTRVKDRSLDQEDQIIAAFQTDAKLRVAIWGK